jgi:hypothetical protein
VNRLKLDFRKESSFSKNPADQNANLKLTPTNPQLLESSTIVDYGMKAIGQLLDKIFYLLLSELLKKISNELI